MLSCKEGWVEWFLSEMRVSFKMAYDIYAKSPLVETRRPVPFLLKPNFHDVLYILPLQPTQILSPTTSKFCNRACEFCINGFPNKYRRHICPPPQGTCPVRHNEWLNFPTCFRKVETQRSTECNKKSQPASYLINPLKMWQHSCGTALKFVGTTLTDQNFTREEMKGTLNSGNACCNSV